MDTKKINLLIFLIPFALSVFGQRVYLIEDIKNDVKYYQEEFGKSYVDSMYYYNGSIFSYEKGQQYFFETRLNLYHLFLSGSHSGNKLFKKIAVRNKTNKTSKTPSSVRVLELLEVELPLPFDLEINKHTYIKRIEDI
jgi:hypothetical protein